MNGVRATAFVGRSFLDADKTLWHDLRDVLDTFKPMGFAYEDAKEAQPERISEKVKTLIKRNDAYIGVLTRRYPIYEAPSSFLGRHGVFTQFVPKQWSTSDWVVEEIGFAIGKDRPVVLLIEEGVLFPTTDLDADTEFVRFNRSNISACQSALTTMITILVNKIAPMRSEPRSAASEVPTAEPAPVSERPKADFGEQLEALRAAAKSGNADAAAKIQSAILDAERAASPEDKAMMEAWLLGERARYGDSAALAALNEQAEEDPLSIDVLIQLFNVYMSFNQFAEAHRFVIRSAGRLLDDAQSTVTLLAARALRKDGRPSEALELITTRLAVETVEKKRASLLRAAAFAAEELSEVDVEAGLLEKVLQDQPADHDSRNRLAYLYDESDKHKLAAYHYGILSGKVDWPNVPNNLAVVYGALGLKASHVENLEHVADKYALAKANLANLYAEGGFVARAIDSAQEALGSAEDHEQAKARARVALTKAEELRRSEGEEIDKIPSSVRDERLFMIDYGVAYCSISKAPIEGRYDTPHGPLAIRTVNGAISGSGEQTRTYSPGLGLLASLSSQAGEGGLFTRTYKLSLKGALHGDAGTYELTIDTYHMGNKTPASTQTIKGLLIASADRSVIRFLERDDKGAKFTQAKRANAAA